MTIEKFKNRIKPQPNGCHYYGKSSRGYSQVHIGERTVYAHRLALELSLGRRLKGNACHTCDNPRCVNPLHLFEGTQLGNMRDCVKKKRHAHGETSYSKLTEKQVIHMRKNFNVNTDTIKGWAKKLGVSFGAIQCALNGTNWKHLPGALKSLKKTGEAHFRSYLTTEQVRDIKLKLVSGSYSKSALARMFKTSYWTINDIARGATWAHVKI